MDPTSGSRMSVKDFTFTDTNNIFDNASSYGTDVFLAVSGSAGSKGTPTKGTSVFGGDVHISGNLTSDSGVNSFTPIIQETTTARTLSDADNGKIILCTNTSSNTTITVPYTMSSGSTVVLMTTAGTSSILIVDDGTSVLVAKPSATVPLQSFEKWSPISVTMLNTSASNALVFGDLA